MIWTVSGLESLRSHHDHTGGRLTRHIQPYEKRPGEMTHYLPPSTRRYVSDIMMIVYCKFRSGLTDPPTSDPRSSICTYVNMGTPSQAISSSHHRVSMCPAPTYQTAESTTLEVCVSVRGGACFLFMQLGLSLHLLPDLAAVGPTNRAASQPCECDCDCNA